MKPSKKELKRESNRQRAFIKEVVYPILLENAESVQDAKNVLSALGTALNAAYHEKIFAKQQELSAELVSFYDLSQLVKKDKKFDKDLKVLEAFKNEKLSTAMSLLEGLTTAISAWEHRDAIKRPLKDLEPDFL